MPLLPSPANLKTTKRQQGSTISNCLFNTCTLSMELLTKRKYQLSHLEVSQTILGLVLGLIQTFKMWTFTVILKSHSRWRRTFTSHVSWTKWSILSSFSKIWKDFLSNQTMASNSRQSIRLWWMLCSNKPPNYCSKRKLRSFVEPICNPNSLLSVFSLDSIPRTRNLWKSLEYSACQSYPSCSSRLNIVKRLRTNW